VPEYPLAKETGSSQPSTITLALPCFPKYKVPVIFPLLTKMRKKERNEQARENQILIPRIEDFP